MAPVKQDIFQLQAFKVPATWLYLLLPLSVLIFVIVRRSRQHKMSSSQNSGAKNYSRAINISDHSGEKLQIHLFFENGSPPSNQPTQNANHTGRPEIPASNTSASEPHQYTQAFDMTSLPLPTATQDMKHHTTTLTEREFAQPVYSEQSNPAAPRLQKETVQVFREVGSETRKNWRRKVLEYR
ncbi:uncharacterized protein GIQ15_05422 [Arthroderma uncinatum]|uniref:uncharacterized protein n=1 Tax=Arthroderma uncinatum TaxID=74035 RepID=UPI00144A886D|nr:uncharacterized protein GIQ15_05422 [Arthroderma uncinatum]KAF3480075.1 hypothetical protein GIQ15_05422 [Arthroderma uncinatum]